MAQTINKIGVQFGTGGSKKAVDTWHQITNGDIKRSNVLIANQGTDNDLTNGTAVFLSVNSDDAAETVSVTTGPTLLALGVGDTLDIDWGDDVTINVQCATADVVLYIEERKNVGSGAKHSI